MRQAGKLDIYLSLYLASQFVLTGTKIRPTDKEIILSRILEKSVRRSGALDTESLCILAGQKCWSVRADVHVLDYDGGLIDAGCLAVVAALQHFRRPDVTVEGETATVYTTNERVPVPLSMLHHPYCISVSLFQSGQLLVIDSTLQEQRVSDGEVIVTANRQGEVCQIAKLGGAAADAILLLRCVELAAEKVKLLSTIVSTAIEEDAERRNLGGLIAELSAENDR